jgi:hypothetical protein
MEERVRNMMNVPEYLDEEEPASVLMGVGQPAPAVEGPNGQPDHSDTDAAKPRRKRKTT